MRSSHILLLSLVLCACGKTKENQTANADSLKINDTISHGHNELANREHLKTFAISDYNTDNPSIDNIKRPSSSTVQTQLDTTLLFAVWTSDPNGPHADFVFSNKSFYVVDYDGDGDMPYELVGRSLKIYYNDFIQEGEVISVNKDSLKIKWKEFEHANAYVKWAN